MVFNLNEILSRTGISAEALDRIRLAQGFVGKSSYVAVSAILMLGALAFALREPSYLLVVACFILVTFLVFFFGALWFAYSRPGEALLEGAELIKWRQLEMKASDVTDLQITQQKNPEAIGDAREP
jgi:hypothetical protein